MDYLQADAVTENIEKQFTRLQQMGRQYRRGCFTLDEGRRGIQDILWNGYFKYVEDFFRFNLNQRVWDSFLEEYHKIEKSIPLGDLKGESWLNSKQWDDDKKIWIPASVSDRTQVLKLMMAFHIPPEYYMPLPDDIPVPSMQRYLSAARSPCVSVSISFECEDDGGLLNCKVPCGKTFTLRDKLGLKAVITIKDVFSEPKEVLYNRTSASYQGEGYIEGYTEMSFQRQDPRLYIGIWEGKVDNLVAFLSDADWHTYYRYPMWQDYFQYQMSENTIFEKVLDSFLL